MYGTVMRYQLKTGMEEAMKSLFAEFEANPPEGFVSSTVYRLDSGQDEYMIAAVHSDREAYVANAQSEAQNAWFQRFREMLTRDVTWDDGEIVEVP
ncbi:MAG: antibiotic biosynthesis monooxygenase [Candidatus Dormibacteria bacterium]